MLYHFELQMAGVILISAMIAGGISLYLKRRREREEDIDADLQDSANEQADT